MNLNNRAKLSNVFTLNKKKNPSCYVTSITYPLNLLKMITKKKKYHKIYI